MLLSAQAREKVFELSRSMTYLELSNEPGYMDEFVAACFLPHNGYPTNSPIPSSKSSSASDVRLWEICRAWSGRLIPACFLPHTDASLFPSVSQD